MSNLNFKTVLEKMEDIDPDVVCQSLLDMEYLLCQPDSKVADESKLVFFFFFIYFLKD
jgi:hypothetical protein